MKPSYVDIRTSPGYYCVRILAIVRPMPKPASHVIAKRANSIFTSFIRAPSSRRRRESCRRIVRWQCRSRSHRSRRRDRRGGGRRSTRERISCSFLSIYRPSIARRSFKIKESNRSRWTWSRCSSHANHSSRCSGSGT